MGNFDLPTSEYRGASMCYLTTLISEKRQRCDSPEDTQLVSMGFILSTLESQRPHIHRFVVSLNLVLNVIVYSGILMFTV